MDSLFEEARGKLAHLDKRLNDAQSFQIPRLRDHTGSLPLQQRYGAELRDDIESCRRELQILEAFVDDIVREKDRKVIYDELDILISKVEQLKKAYRSALLISKRAIDAQVRSHRDELLQSSAISSTPESSRNKGSGASEDALMSANAAVTDTLRRTTQLMHQEIERSALSTQMLEESTRTLSMTSDLYTMFGSLMDTSKTLVTALEKSDWLDRLLILSSLAFFLLVVAYILKKRIIDKGIWLAFWWIKYLPLGKPSAASAPPSPSLLHSQPQVTLQTTTVMKQEPVPVDTVSSLVTLSITAAIIPAAASSSATISHLASAALSAAHGGSLMDSIVSTSLGKSAEPGIGVLEREAETPGKEEPHLEFDSPSRTRAVRTHGEL